MSSSKRASTTTGPKPPTRISSSVTIADNTSMTGTHLITLGSHTVVHPRSKFNSTFAPVTVGSTCIISERCQVGLQGEPEPDQQGVVIEDGVVIEPGAVVEATRVGEGSVIEVNAKVGRGATVGKHCKIGPLCEIAVGETLPDFTVVFANGMRRIDRSGIEELKLKMVARQGEVLKKLIPSNLAKFQ